MRPGSPAARAGLRVGSRIISINGVSVSGETHERSRSNFLKNQFKGLLKKLVFLTLKRTENMLKSTRGDRKVILVISIDSFVPMDKPPSYGDLNPLKEL